MLFEVSVSEGFEIILLTVHQYTGMYFVICFDKSMFTLKILLSGKNKNNNALYGYRLWSLSCSVHMLW